MAPVPGAGMATQGISPRRWVPLVAALVLVSAGAVAWMLFRPAPGGDQVADQTVAATPLETPTPTPAPGPVETLAEPTPTPVTDDFTPPVQPRETPRDRGQAPQLPQAEPSPRREPPIVETRPTPAPVPVQPVPTPAPAEPQRPAAEEPAPSEPEPSRPLPSPGNTDRTVRSGLALAFRVTPPDAMVLVDRTVIGRAKEWSGEKGARSYTLDGPGEYLITIKKDGMKDYRIAVQASATGGITPIIATLSPLPAAEVEEGDLRTVRVSEAVAFRVRPPGAMILVDDQIAGPALKFNGGLRGGWLNLPPGRHRISVRAPGHRRHDLIVEVMPGAIQKREKIDVNLFQGGDD